MRNKVKTKVFNSILDYKRIVTDFDDYLHDNTVMCELSCMSLAQVINIIKEVWEEIKAEN